MPVSRFEIFQAQADEAPYRESAALKFRMTVFCVGEAPSFNAGRDYGVLRLESHPERRVPFSAFVDVKVQKKNWTKVWLTLIAA